MIHRILHDILRHRSRGASLVVVMIALTLVSFAVISMYVIFMSNNNNLNNHTESKKMYYYARSGINIAEAAIVNQGDAVFKGLAANPTAILTDTIDRSKWIAESDLTSPFSNNSLLPENIEIKIRVEYLTNAKAAAISPPSSPGAAPKYEGFLMLTSEAKNKSTGKSSFLVKYLDPTGLRSQYQ